MISAEQWKEDCFDGITAAYTTKHTTLSGAGALRLSVKKPIDEAKMRDDTLFRTHGACGILKPGKVARLGLALNKLWKAWRIQK